MKGRRRPAEVGQKVLAALLAVASEATIFICRPSKASFAFSPPIARTGIVSLV